MSDDDVATQVARMDGEGGAPATGEAASIGNPLFDPEAEVRETERLVIFDTTLRDGEQSPGVSLNVDDKLAIARQLARLNVDIIEAGFPIASEGDFAAVKAIAEQIDGPIITGLSRVWPDDVKRCAEALKPARRARIHVFVGTSPIHRQFQLRMSQKEVYDRAVEMTALAKTFREDVEFSPMDASRTEPEFLAEVVAGTIEAGATTINLPDTVGYATPEEWGRLIEWLKVKVPRLNEVVISVHCHNDLGLATANSMASIRAGARQIEVCVNGIGERAGNAALEEVAMTTQLHPEVFGVRTNLDHSQLYRTSRLVSQLTGMLVQPNRAVVGANAFAHHSGIHQDGVLKNRSTFEIMNAADVGSGSSLVLGKLSGRHALRARLEELGYQLNDQELKAAFVRFKELADKKKEVGDRDLEAIVADEARIASETFRLDHIQVSSGTGIRPTATVRLEMAGGRMEEAVSTGDGPVDAAFRAINSLVDVPNELEEFAVQAVTEGIDAVGEVSVRVRDGEALVSGHAADTDIIVAAARAYIHALNKLVSGGGRPRLTPENMGAAEASAGSAVPAAPAPAGAG